MSAVDPVPEAISLMERVLVLLAGLDPNAAAKEIRSSLRSATPQAGLMLLMVARLDIVEAVLPELLVVAARDRYAELVEQIFARFPRSRREQILNQELLGRSLDGADDFHYRRLAGLFYELRQDSALEFLVKRAAVSNDPEIREIARDYGGRYPGEDEIE